MQSIKSDKRPETDFVVGGQANGIAFIVVWDGGGVIDFDNCISCRVDVREWVGGCVPYGLIDPDDIAYSVRISIGLHIMNQLLLRSLCVSPTVAVAVGRSMPPKKRAEK